MGNDRMASQDFPPLTNLLIRGGVVFLAGLLAVAKVGGDEGMFPLSDLERVDLQGRGIGLTAVELFNPDGVSLVDGICRVNGCTGSFVSAEGLILTNHHCAYDAIQKASRPGRDLLADGFSAAGRADEIPAPDYTVRVTEGYRDVSAEVLAAVQPEMEFAARTRAIERRRKELELAAEAEHPGMRAEVAEMFQGRTWVLFLYTYLRDVRLVFAPPSSTGNFGGEVDNWEWPRHTGDFSFMRAYVAPDGTPATYAADNVPYRPKRVIRIAPGGVAEGDAVFLLGYPGRTARHRTASFLRYERDVRLPLIAALYRWQIDEMDRAGAGDRAVAILHASRSKSLANVEKRARGQLQGLRRARLVEQREAAEQQLQAFIDADGGRRARYGTLLEGIDAVYAEMTAAAPLEIHLDQLRSACRAAAFGWQVCDGVMERAKPDLERESPWMDRNFALTMATNRAAMQDWHPPTDRIMLAGILDRLAAIPEAHSIAALQPLIADRAAIPAVAERMIGATRLGEQEFVERCMTLTPRELETVDDPLLGLVRSLYPVWMEIREREKAREGKLNQLYGSLIEIKQQFAGTAFVPDANGTLRFTSGRVKGYSPADGVVKLPITTLEGVIEKTTGQEPFDTPAAVLRAHENREFGAFALPGRDTVPVAILYDTDTTGGNSGSPVLNAQGELVGVNFDRCFEATINDFAWNANYSRSIGVDIRYVLWITGVVSGAGGLLEEMEISGDSMRKAPGAKE